MTREELDEAFGQNNNRQITCSSIMINSCFTEDIKERAAIVLRELKKRELELEIIGNSIYKDKYISQLEAIELELGLG